MRVGVKNCDSQFLHKRVLESSLHTAFEYFK